MNPKLLSRIVIPAGRGRPRPFLPALGLCVLLAAGAAVAQQQWSPASSGVSADLRGVAYGGGVFVAVGADGVILRSADHGQTWQDRTDPGQVWTGFLVDVAYGNGVFLATGGEFILISTDLGLTWSKAADLEDSCAGLAFGGGRWVAACHEAIRASTDNGTSWTPVYDPVAGEAQGTDVLVVGSQCVVVGGSILHSADGGQTFADVGNLASNWLVDVAYGNGAYVVIGGVFGNVVFRSTAPGNWPLDSLTEIEGIDGLDGIAFGNGQFVATAGEGKILVSDGTSPWQPAVSGVTAWLKGVAYGDGTFVVVGDGGTILTSGRPPEINSALTASGKVGQAFSYQITALYGPTGYDAAGMPTGLSINRGTGLISGTPGTAGTYPVALSASNPHGSDTRTLTLTVLPAGSGGDFRVNIYTAVELEWDSKAGKTYQVQTSPDFKSWSNFESPIAGTGQKLYRLYSTRDPARRFYRVQEL